MKVSEYEKYDGMGLAELLHRKAVSPLELMQCAIELAEARGNPLNALSYKRYDESLEIASAAKPVGPFGAVPFLLKDSALASRRFPSSVGSRLFEETRFSVNASLTSRFEESGFIPFARTTVPEFCMAPTTEAMRNEGPTRNPWDLRRSAGGSSGGAAAAVATGIVPVAHGSDGGGSIRIPAACCGVFGLKASRGLVPMGPLRGEGWGGLAVDGVLSRTVRDTALALDAIAGADAGAPYAAPARPQSYLKNLTTPFERPLRIAKWTTAWDGIDVASECVEAVEEVARLLRSLGHEVVDEAPMELSYASFVEAHMDILATNIVVSVNGKVKGQPIDAWKDLLEPAMLDGYHRGQKIAAEKYVLAINRFHSIGRQFENYMADVDLILTPTLTQLPAPLGQFSMQTDFQTFRSGVAKYTTYLAVINASGQPAANVPVCATREGIPVGVQLIGHFGDDDMVLRVSAQLEQAAPWAARRPSASGK